MIPRTTIRTMLRQFWQRLGTRALLSGSSASIPVIPHRSRAICFFLVMAFLFAPTAHAQQAWLVPCHQLAKQIVERTDHASALSLSVKNLSSLSASDLADVRKTLIQQLAASGVSVTSPERAVANIALTLSQNSAGYLWIAQLQQGSSQQLIMLPVALPASVASPQSEPALVLHKVQIWSAASSPANTSIENTQIAGANTAASAAPLDAELLHSGATTKLLLLTADSVSLYTAQQSRWVLEQSQPIAHAQAWPRDLRGRLWLPAPHRFQAFLPGTLCEGEFDPGVAMQCRPSDDPWPLAGSAAAPVRAFFSRRNFFTGALSGAAVPAGDPPFFSAAVIAGPGAAPVLLFAGTDGVLRDQQSRPAPLNTGSDIAAINSGCGSGWQLLATGLGDRTQPDTLSVFDVTTGSAQPALAPVEFAGPITALWPTTAADSAVAIAHNLENGKDEAFLLSITCR
jgi:hypothetical protein